MVEPGSGAAAPAPARSRRRVVALVVGTVASVVLLALALVFSSSFAAQRVAENARALHWTNATLGSMAIARASNAQAVVFAVDAELGVATDEAAAVALGEAEANLADLEAWLGGASAALGGEAPAMAEAVAELVADGRQVLDLIGAGDLEQSLDLNSGGFEATYQQATRLLAGEQQVIADRIDATEDLAGTLSGLIRFAVTLLIPAAAVIAYRFIARRQLQRRRVEIESRLETERRLSKARDEFIANISHEIRTPLTTIFGFSEVLLEGAIEDPESARDLLRLINDESTELSRMVEDLLTAARIDAGALDFNMEDVRVVDEIEAVVAPLRRSGVGVAVDCPDVVLWADRLRLRQVLRNLVSNAHRHGGDAIAVIGTHEGGRFTCRVEDDGPGVPADMEERLFQRFVHKGSEPLLAGSVGLGLAIAYSLADSMGGSLTYRRVDGWTRFELEVPVATDGRAPAALTVRPDVLLSHGRRRSAAIAPDEQRIAAFRSGEGRVEAPGLGGSDR